MDWGDRIGRRLKLRDVHILLAVVQRGSMAKAADYLAISQPVVSKAIADLEHTLGVRLLDRGRQGVELTLYGRAVLHHGLAAFDELRQAVKEVESLADPSAGEVRIGATEPMVAGLLPVVINRLHRRYPRITFDVTQAPGYASLYRDLRERNVDILIGRILTLTIEEDMDVEILFNDPQFVVAGVTNRWAKRRAIELADLIDEPWILPRSESSAGSLVAETFRACGLEAPQKVVVCNSIQMHIGLIATGDFLSMLPRSLFRFSANRLSIKMLPVKLPSRPAPVGMITLKKRTISPTVQLFMDSIRELAEPLAEDSRSRKRALGKSLHDARRGGGPSTSR
jgi:DNA-binding transcriptional LysR family regulator